MKNEKHRTKINIAWQEPAIIQIGKSGVSDNLVKETIRHLKKHKYIKVRMLRSALDSGTKQELMTTLCERTGATFEGIRGNTGIVYKIRAGQ
ncbi:MAG: YhbY family RNA-binding protein [Candidatus Thorarchaeota archaeon]